MSNDQTNQTTLGMGKMVEDPLEVKISLQKNVWSPPSEEPTVGQVLNWIQTGKYENHVTRLREFLRAGERDKYEEYKIRLPGVTFSGTFGGIRRVDALKNYSGLLIFDIDDIEGDDFVRIQEALTETEFVFSHWRSPSGVGIKGLIKLEYLFPIRTEDIHAYHKHAFSRVWQCLNGRYGVSIDKSGSDITRLCFLSSDPLLRIKFDSAAFQIEPPTVSIVTPSGIPGTVQDVSAVETKTDDDCRKFQVAGKNSPVDRQKIQSIIKFLRKRNLSITSTYSEWYRVAYAITSAFTYDIGERYYLQLCALDGPRYDKEQSEWMLQYCYKHSRGQIGFGTIVHLAATKGFTGGGYRR